MRTLRLRPVLSVANAARSASLGLSAAALLAPMLAAAQGAPAGDTKVKYVYKPVACTPCPCECPDPKSIPTTTTTAGTAPAPQGREPAASDPIPAPSRPQAPPSPSGGGAGGGPSGARGDIGGVVVVRNKSGGERADRSNAVVYIEGMSKKYAALKKVRAMAQRDKSFVPTVIAITKGSVVDFPNEDKFFHNVFSLSEGNTFDLGLYRAGESKSVTFERTGVVDVYCNIHPQMWAQILVLDNPFFTTTNKDGSFELPKVPPGTYSVAAWMQGGSPVRQSVKVEPGKRAVVNLDLVEGVKFQPHNNKENKSYGRYQ